MAAAALIAKFFAQLRDGAAGDQDVALAWDIAAPAGLLFTQTLVAGAFNSVNFPPTYTLLIIIPPTTNTQAVLLKSVTGDDGVALHRTLPSVLAVHDSFASIGLTLGAGTDQLFTFGLL